MQFFPALTFYSGAIKQVWKIDSSRNIARVIRWTLRIFLNPFASLRWFRALSSVPDLGSWLKINPRLLLKPTRHYISRAYSQDSRINIILNHYRILGTLFSPSALNNLKSARPITMARLTGKHGSVFEVAVRMTEYDREGELILELLNHTRNLRVFCFVFSINENSQVQSIEIGCIQGPRGDHALELIKEATKELHGIRPKNLLIEAIYCLKQCWNIAEVHGISNEARVFNQDTVYSDYDTFWNEVGGSRDRDGFFRLPPGIVHKTSSIPANRRAEYARRHTLRTELSIQTAQNCERMIKEQLAPAHCH